MRSVNTRDLAAYLRRIEAGEPATGPTESLDPEGRARETAMLMLRRTILGIDRDDFRLRTGYRPGSARSARRSSGSWARGCSRTTAGACG